MHGATKASVTLAILVVAASPAAADRDEHRLSVAGDVSLVSLDAFATNDSTEAYGARLGLARGIRNWLEVGLDTTYLVRTNAILAGAFLDNGDVGMVGGDGFELYTNLHDVKLGAHARLSLEGGPLYRVRPFVGIRAGVGLQFLTSPELFDPDGQFVLGADADTRLAPFGGADFGLSWRFAETVHVALLGSMTVSSGSTFYGAQLELSRFSYDWL